MKKPGFLEGVVVALIFSIVGRIGYSVLTTFFSVTDSWRLLIAAMCLAYSLYLLARSQQLTGRISVLLSWLMMAFALGVFEPPIIHYALIHLGTVWLLRCLYFHTGFMAALLDSGLNGLSLVAACWAMIHSGSVWLSLWCFFLLQALFVAIPGRLTTAPANQSAGHSHAKFQQALRTAQSAVNRLSRTPLD